MKTMWMMILLPVWAFAETDMPTSTSVPAAPTAAQQELVNACLEDMPRRVGMWKSHGDLACGCMFTGATAWAADADPARAEAKSRLLAAIIKQGGITTTMRDKGLREGLEAAEIANAEKFARVYPAVLFKNKDVVGCFNNKCRETPGCQVEMNDISGTAPTK